MEPNIHAVFFFVLYYNYASNINIKCNVINVTLQLFCHIQRICVCRYVSIHTVINTTKFYVTLLTQGGIPMLIHCTHQHKVQLNAYLIRKIRQCVG